MVNCIMNVINFNITGKETIKHFVPTIECNIRMQSTQNHLQNIFAKKKFLEPHQVCRCKF